MNPAPRRTKSLMFKVGVKAPSLVGEAWQARRARGATLTPFVAGAMFAARVRFPEAGESPVTPRA